MPIHTFPDSQTDLYYLRDGGFIPAPKEPRHISEILPEVVARMLRLSGGEVDLGEERSGQNDKKSQHRNKSLLFPNLLRL